MAVVLTRLPGGEGTIRQSDGKVALTHDVTLDRGQTLQPWDNYQPVRIGLSDDRMLFGGLLPPGAVSVEAVEATGVRKLAAVGGDTYAVIFEDGQHGAPALGYRDAAGQFVKRPMPAEYPCQPVSDAEEPCPICGAIEYDVYFPTEGWRGGQGRKGTDSFIPSPLVVCRICGHQEQSGGIFRYGQADDPEEDQAARAERLAHARAKFAAKHWHSNKTALNATTFPIYAAGGWDARINGHGSHDGKVTSILIGHSETPVDLAFVGRPRIEIETSIVSYLPGDLALARERFASRIETDENRKPTDDLSDAALTLWFRAARRRRAMASHKAPVGEARINIDGKAQPFLIVGTPNAYWVAVRRHGDSTITITAREIDPTSLTLTPILDLGTDVLGPEPDAI
jgi:hypothetical protein